MRIVVFKNTSDLIELRNLLYGSPDDQRRGMALCKAYQTRGPLPPSVHLTCQLLAAIHADLPHVDLYAIRLTYSMALIRFVNEILDAAQQGKSVVPLYALAQMADLPASFVELRHAATHEDLPSIYLLRDMANRAVAWLWSNFWSLQTLDAESRQSSVKPSPTEQEYKGGVKDLLREWRRIKRADSKANPPEHLISELQSRWNAGQQEFLDVVLTQNVLVPATSSSTTPKVNNSIVLLYLPVFESLGSEFCSQLLTRILEALQSREWPTSSSDVREKKQFPIFQAWAEALAKYLNSELIGLLSSAARPWNALVLARFASSVGDRALYETAEEMAEFTGCDDDLPNWEPGWKKVPGWTPRPLGIL